MSLGPDQGQGLFDGPAHRDRPEPRRRLPRKIEQAADDARAVLDGRLYLIEVFPELLPVEAAPGQPVFHELGVDEDAGQGIVELVGDPGGKLADRAELGRLDKLLLRLLELRDGVVQLRVEGEDLPVGLYLVFEEVEEGRPQPADEEGEEGEKEGAHQGKGRRGEQERLGQQYAQHNHAADKDAAQAEDDGRVDERVKEDDDVNVLIVRQDAIVGEGEDDKEPGDDPEVLAADAVPGFVAEEAPDQSGRLAAFFRHWRDARHARPTHHLPAGLIILFSGGLMSLRDHADEVGRRSNLVDELSSMRLPRRLD